MKDCKQDVTDYAMLRKRWRDSLTGGDIAWQEDADIRKRLHSMEEEAGELWRTMVKHAYRTCLWEDLPDPNDVYQRDWVCSSTFSRIEKLTLAFCTKGSSLFGQSQLLDDVLSAMEFIYQNWYNATIRKGGEWWYKEIGLPLKVNNCMVLLYDVIPDKLKDDYMRTVESFTFDPHLMCLEDIPEVSTGANRVWKCYALAGLGILMGDAEKLMTCAGFIKDVFQYTDKGDGFYRDGSFVQHRKFAYTGGYGLSLLMVIADYMDLLRDTEWQLGETELTMLIEWIDNAYAPLIYKGGILHMVQGREIAREYAQEHKAGHLLIQSLMKMTKSLPAEQKAALKKKIKYWITADTYLDFFSDAPIAQISEAKAIMDDPAVIPWEESDDCRIYAGMDRVVHRRRDFTFAISMSSERIGKYESIHDENLRGWYTSEGTTCLYNADLAQYSEGYFPTVNAYRMPGTTVDTMVRKEKGVGYGQEPPLHRSWVGGCQMNQRYGIAGMDLEAHGSDLTAKKSWFLFDEEIVCLGADITCTENRPVETIVDNRKVSPRAGQNIEADMVSIQQAEVSGNGKVMHIKGAVPDSDIGYYFPTSCQTETVEEIRTDCWNSIQDRRTHSKESLNSASAREISNRYATIVIPHGINPREAQYQYIILPGKGMEQLRAYGMQPQVEILENSGRLQAVRHAPLHITGANFWKEEGGSIAGITCHGQASVIMQEFAGCISIAVADPMQRREESLLVEVDRAAADIFSCDSRIRVLKLSPVVMISVDVKGTHGRSLQIAFRLKG